jgi:hypothetical protein
MSRWYGMRSWLDAHMHGQWGRALRAGFRLCIGQLRNEWVVRIVGFRSSLLQLRLKSGSHRMWGRAILWRGAPWRSGVPVLPIVGNRVAPKVPPCKTEQFGVLANCPGSS